MARRKQIKSKQQFDNALVLEKLGDTANALKLYQKATTTDPANSHAWNRQMVLFRKTKTKEDEVKLIRAAISEYQKSVATAKQVWMEEHKEKADSSRELASVLGLLEANGLPKNDDATIEKWQTRLYLLEYKIKNARKKKTTAKKRINKPLQAKASIKKKLNKQLKGINNQNLSTKCKLAGYHTSIGTSFAFRSI